MADYDAQGNFFDTVSHTFAKKLARIIKLSEFRREELAAKLMALDMPITPEQYTASAVVKAALSLILIAPALVIFPLLALGVVVIALVIYFHEKNTVDRLLDEKRSLIDREVPRFARVLAENLEYNRDIIAIFEKYKETALSPFFRREIDKAVADAKISSPEEALIRFDERINSKYLSDVIRGLLGIINGSEGFSHFEMIVRDIKKEEYEMLKREAVKRPDKLKKWSVMLFILFIASIFLVIILDVIRQVQMINTVS
jgi:tight adherence protein C